MARTDRLKEEIGWLKLVFSFLAGTDISLLAWLAQNYRVAGRLTLLSALGAIVFLTVATFWSNMIAYRRISEIEET